MIYKHESSDKLITKLTLGSIKLSDKLMNILSHYYDSDLTNPDLDCVEYVDDNEWDMVKHQINIIFKDKSSGAINNQVKLHKFNNIDYNNSYGIKLWYNNGKQIIKYYNNFTDMRNNIEKLE